MIEIFYLRIQGDPEEEAELGNNAVQDAGDGEEVREGEVTVAHALEERHSGQAVSEGAEAGEADLNEAGSPFHELDEGVLHVDGGAPEEARPLRVEIDGCPPLAVQQIPRESALQQTIV